MDELTSNVKQSIVCEVSESKGARKSADDALERMYYCLSSAIDYLDKPFYIEDFKIGRYEDGVERELLITVRMLDSYCEDFHELLARYEKLGDNDD